MRTIKIVSNGTMRDAQISLDGVDISSLVTRAELVLQPHSACVVRLELIGKLDIELPAEIVVQE